MLDRYSEAISEVATRPLKTCVDDYVSRVRTATEEDTALECAAADEDGVFTDCDVASGIGQTIYERLKNMTPNQYQELAMRTCSIRATALRTEDGVAFAMLDNAMLGLCGETGECADMVKKYLYQGHDFDKTHMAKELGDVAWYLAEAAEAIGYSLEDILQMNIDKLKARYPEGHFDYERSQHRKEDDV